MERQWRRRGGKEKRLREQKEKREGKENMSENENGRDM